MAEFPPSGGLPLQTPSYTHSAGRAGFIPVSFAPLPGPEGALRQAVTPDQQAIYIFYFIIEGMPLKVKSWFRFSFWGGFAAGYKFFS